jgi:peptide/nickel transport system ATP-binding protein
MSEYLMEVKNLKKYFKTRSGMLHAVDGVTFSLRPGETLGVVGESGCGKSTLGRTLVKLLEPTEGQILFEGEDITYARGVQLKRLRTRIQMIFQDPFSSLNPRKTVRESILEPLKLNSALSARQREEQVLELMNTVGLAQRLAHSYPHELDGGRRQRIGIARALALNPAFIVCDEPVSALDVSIQAQILNLMQDVQEDQHLAYLFITHDLSVVRHMANQILVMYLGQMVELTSADVLFERQMHPYTQALLSAIPVPSLEKRRQRIILRGEITSPINPPAGCRFAPRCPYVTERCTAQTPELYEAAPGHFVACHRVGEVG